MGKGRKSDPHPFVEFVTPADVRKKEGSSMRRLKSPISRAISGRRRLPYLQIKIPTWYLPDKGGLPQPFRLFPDIHWLES